MQYTSSQPSWAKGGYSPGPITASKDLTPWHHAKRVGDLRSTTVTRSESFRLHFSTSTSSSQRRDYTVRSLNFMADCFASGMNTAEIRAAMFVFGSTACLGRSSDELDIHGFNHVLNVFCNRLREFAANNLYGWSDSWLAQVLCNAPEDLEMAA